MGYSTISTMLGTFLSVSLESDFFFVSGQGQSLPQSAATHPMADMEKTETDRSQTCMVTEVGTLESLMRYESGLLSM